jgi:UDP-glucose 4-epimerase
MAVSPPGSPTGAKKLRLGVMRVVVSGASGFVARRVLDRLRALQADAIGVARRAVPTDMGIVLVTDYADAPAGDVLVHLAESSDRRRVALGGAAYEAQTLATLASLLGKPYSRVVYASSAILYGDQSSRPSRPEDPVVVGDAYARVKCAAETAVLRRGGGVVARLANLYGPGMSKDTVISTILSQIPGAGPLVVADDSPIRDFLWVDDAAAALAGMALGTPVGVFNAGSGRGASVRDVAETALKIAGESQRSVVASAPARQPSRLVLDIDTTIASFNWQPSVPLSEGLSRLLSSPTR